MGDPGEGGSLGVCGRGEGQLRHVVGFVRVWDVVMPGLRGEKRMKKAITFASE